MLKVRCPYCGFRCPIEGGCAELRIRCKECGKSILVPEQPTRKWKVGGVSLLGVIGLLLCLVGLILVVRSLRMDATVEVPIVEVGGHVWGGDRVYSVGLMDERRNGIILGVCAALGGFLLMLIAGISGRRWITRQN